MGLVSLEGEGTPAGTAEISPLETFSRSSHEDMGCLADALCYHLFRMVYDPWRYGCVPCVVSRQVPISSTTTSAQLWEFTLIDLLTYLAKVRAMFQLWYDWRKRASH